MFLDLIQTVWWRRVGVANYTGALNKSLKHDFAPNIDFHHAKGAADRLYINNVVVHFFISLFLYFSIPLLKTENSRTSRSGLIQVNYAIVIMTYWPVKCYFM